MQLAHGCALFDPARRVRRVHAYTLKTVLRITGPGISRSRAGAKNTIGHCAKQEERDPRGNSVREMTEKQQDPSGETRGKTQESSREKDIFSLETDRRTCLREKRDPREGALFLSCARGCCESWKKRAKSLFSSCGPSDWAVRGPRPKKESDRVNSSEWTREITRPGSARDFSCAQAGGRTRPWHVSGRSVQRRNTFHFFSLATPPPISLFTPARAQMTTAVAETLRDEIRQREECVLDVEIASVRLVETKVKDKGTKNMPYFTGVWTLKVRTERARTRVGDLFANGKHLKNAAGTERTAEGELHMVEIAASKAPPALLVRALSSFFPRDSCSSPPPRNDCWLRARRPRPAPGKRRTSTRSCR